MSTITNNVRRLLDEIGTAKLVCVTKGRTVEEMKEAIDAGVTMIGENRVQKAAEKFPKLAQPIEKHFLGRIQTNKIKIIVELFDMVQSVDRIDVAEKLNAEAEKQHKPIRILIQVNIDKDPQKAGIMPEQLSAFLAKIQKLPFLHIEGLMTIGKLTEDPNEARTTFQAMKKLHAAVCPKLPEISMGMSNDYPIAIKEGATMVRVGRAIFS